MIRHIRGTLAGISSEAALVDVGGITYEVFLPPHVRERLEGQTPGTEVQLATYHYLQSDPSKSVPILLGFENDLQRAFFELLMDVPRFGPRAALRTMSIPVPTFAKAIELQDTQMLKSLPGVGPQKAKDIIATLAGKLGRFIDAHELERVSEAPERPLAEFESDALLVLTQLGINRAEAMQMVQDAREANPDLRSADDIVKAVFQRR